MLGRGDAGEPLLSQAPPSNTHTHPSIQSIHPIHQPSIQSTHLPYRDTSLKYAFIYHFFGLLWTNQFIVAFGCVVIAGAIGQYYWSRGDTSAMPALPVVRSLRNATIYHLGARQGFFFVFVLGGAAQRTLPLFSAPSLPLPPPAPLPLFPTHNNNPNTPPQTTPNNHPNNPQNNTGSIALGSFIVAVIQFIRFALEYLDRKTKSMQARCFGVGWGGFSWWREGRGCWAVWRARGALCPSPLALLCSPPPSPRPTDRPTPANTRASPRSERNETTGGQRDRQVGDVLRQVLHVVPGAGARRGVLSGGFGGELRGGWRV